MKHEPKPTYPIGSIVYGWDKIREDFMRGKIISQAFDYGENGFTARDEFNVLWDHADKPEINVSKWRFYTTKVELVDAMLADVQADLNINLKQVDKDAHKRMHLEALRKKLVFEEKCEESLNADRKA